MYKENFDPGFQELMPEDFFPLFVTDKIKSQIIINIESEFLRLKVNDDWKEYLCFQEIGTTKLEMVPAFNLGLFLNYLKTLETSN